MVIEGKVAHGRELGRKLGFPTANIELPCEALPENGVYRSRVEIDGVWHHAMSNVGYNPSVGGRTRRIETHIFDFCGDLYGRRIKVELLEKIRDEICFASTDELRRQIGRDRESIIAMIKKVTI